MFKICKRNIFTKFGKTEVFETLLPLKSDLYFQRLLESRKQTFYLGVDPTAKSLQIGNLFPIVALLKVWKSGHNIIALVGGATGRIGDPTGRNSDRLELSSSVVLENSSGISRDILRIVDNFSENFTKDRNENFGSFQLLNNIDWVSNTYFLDFITNVLGRFRFSDIRNKRSFGDRLTSETSINMKELIYPFIQAYDWLHLYRTYDCRFQIGGDDQQGNMHLGQILIDKSQLDTAYALTVPLFTVNGEKVGKSNSNSRFTMWLNPDIQSPYSLYYNLLHVPHGIILQTGILKRLTFLNEEEINQKICEHKKNPNANILQKVLASEIIRLVHGPRILETVETAHELFSCSSKELLNDLLLRADQSEMVRQNIPFVPNIKLDLSEVSFDGNRLLHLVNDSTNKMENSEMLMKFNGIDVTDLSVPLMRCHGSQSICGIFQLGSNRKWIVCR